jgi:propionate CoA-transferase
MDKVISVADAIALIQDGDTVAATGYGGNGIPEDLYVELERRFLETGSPLGLTLLYPAGQGDVGECGLNRLAYEGLLRRVIGGHFALTPRLERLILDNRVEAYNFPEGVLTHLFRDIAGGRPGTLSRVGIGTFVDPRQEGGKANEAAKEDLVELVNLGGQETLFYRAFPINVALVRGTTADADGNITMEKESVRLGTLSIAMAARNSGGIVISQVERVAETGSLDARRVRLPGSMVDCVVVARPENHMQTYGASFNPALSGELRVPLKEIPQLPLDARKVIARRAAIELLPNSIVNLGVGLPDAIGQVASEERTQDLITLTVDPGVYGGVPLGGNAFGASVNFTANIDHPYQFDFIDGGGLDVACLGFAQCDRLGSVNASRFSGRIAGCGGFINIAANSKTVIFVGTFTAGGFKAEIATGEISILQEGKHSKFVEHLQQVTFNGALSAESGQDVLYVTERAVFKLRPEGLTLVEVAPGIDVERDILSLMPFKPEIATFKAMDTRLFRDEPMGLRDQMLDLRIEDRLSYDAKTNTVFMDYAGMRVVTRNDLRRIKEAVDGLLSPLGKRVNSIVNYERFEASPDILPEYLDLVRYVQERYYLKVSRYTTSGFMRLKMGKGLENREVPPHVFLIKKRDEDALR